MECDVRVRHLATKHHVCDFSSPLVSVWNLLRSASGETPFSGRNSPYPYIQRRISRRGTMVGNTSTTLAPAHWRSSQDALPQADGRDKGVSPNTTPTRHLPDAHIGSTRRERRFLSGGNERTWEKANDKMVTGGAGQSWGVPAGRSALRLV